MATLTSQTLKIENVDDKNVRVRVNYKLTPSVVEKLAGTVFSGNIQLIGDDLGVASDIVITTFSADIFAVNNATTFVDRTVSRVLPKSALNEDSGFQSTGAEESDEIFARITLSYAAAAPNPPALPSPRNTNFVEGAWK
jgi:hypothetical protein